MIELIQKFIALIEGNQTLLTIFGIGGAGTLIMWLKGIPVGIFNVLKKEFTTEMVISGNNSSYYQIMKLIRDRYKNKNFRRLKLINGRYGDGDTVLSMGYGTHFLCYGHTFFMATLSKEAGNQTQYDKDELVLLKVGRNHKVFEQLAEDAKRNDEERKESNLYEMDNCWSFVRVLRKRNLDSIFIEAQKKELILRTLDEFIKREMWYAEHGIPYQLGILLYGPPGTGKTSLIRAIASYLNYSIYYLSPIKLSGIKGAIGSLPDHCLMVIEDIDSNASVKKAPHSRRMPPGSTASGGKKAIFSSGDSRNEEDEESDMAILQSFMQFGMSEILNSIDGLFSAHGRILIATTNHLDKLAPELIRPGRIDLKVEIGCVNPEILKLFLDRFFPENKIPPEEIDILRDITVADLQELALRGYNEYQILDFVKRGSE